VPTEAGDALLAYARRIIALNDEAAVSLGATAAAAPVRVGLTQDFLEDVLPDALARFSRRRPGVQVEVRAGRNYALEEEVRAGRLDVAVAFFPSGSDRHGTLLGSLPMLWLGGTAFAAGPDEEPIPLVMYDHPCLFRQTALQALERKRRRWRLSLTTPSLPGVWAAVRYGQGITVRTAHRVPAGIRDVGAELGLPRLPSIELRMLTAGDLPPAASELRDILHQVIGRRVAAPKAAARRASGRRAATRQA
jgi:DNA-binding transcriptional LysR family regulator